MFLKLTESLILKHAWTAVTIPMLLPLKGENAKILERYVEISYLKTRDRKNKARWMAGGRFVCGKVGHSSHFKQVRCFQFRNVPPVSSVTGCSRQTVVSRSPWLEEAARDYRYVEWRCRYLVWVGEGL